MKIVLAYSGGLDTSIALSWLKTRYSAEVIAFCANIGQTDNLSEVESRAKANGASKVYVKDLREEFLRDYAFPLLRASATYERRYHMAASLSRPLIAKKLIELAYLEGADAIAHGATGKGNDQIRFYTAATAIDPNISVISPVLEWDLTTRGKQIEYAALHNLELPPFKTSPYSRDSNIWGSSIECGSLDEITQAPPVEVFTLTKEPDQSLPAEQVELTFEHGVPTRLNGEQLLSYELVNRIHAVGGQHGIGRLDFMENRLVGFKVRGVYESPAAEILAYAKRELDDLVHERDLLHLMPSLSQSYAELTYDGKWFGKARLALDVFFKGIAQRASGTIKLKIYAGGITPISRCADHSLYDIDIASYESEEQFDHQAGLGFAYLWAMQARVDARHNRITDTLAREAS